MTPEESYILKTVTEDLVFLREKWDQEIDDASLRRSSNVLRILLVEDAYGKAWRLAGLEKQPRIYAPDLEEALEGLPRERIRFAQAGGAVYKGVRIASALMTDFAMSDSQIKERAKKRAGPPKKAFWLSEFADSPCLIINSVEVKRRELVQYVANKLGGAHLDLRRDPTKELDRKFMALDSLPGIVIAGKASVYYELLSIGQALARSSDTEKFLKRIRNLRKY